MIPSHAGTEGDWIEGARQTLWRTLEILSLSCHHASLCLSVEHSSEVEWCYEWEAYFTWDSSPPRMHPLMNYVTPKNHLTSHL